MKLTLFIIFCIFVVLWIIFAARTILALIKDDDCELQCLIMCVICIIILLLSLFICIVY